MILRAGGGYHAGMIHHGPTANILSEMQSEICVRFYAREFDLYGPRIAERLAAGTLPFTRAWVVCRAKETGSKHSIESALDVIRELESWGIGADLNFRLDPNWADPNAWTVATNAIRSLPDWVCGPCSPLCGVRRTLWIDAEEYSRKYGAPPADLEKLKWQAADLRGELVRAERVGIYPCVKTYGLLAPALGGHFLGDELFDFCRMLCGFIPNPHTDDAMTQKVRKERLAAEAHGATYVPGMICQMLRPQFFSAARRWWKINLSAGVPVTADWQVFIDDRPNFLGPNF